MYPDGSTFLFLGDPSLPSYEEPNPSMMIREGTWIASSVGAAMPVMPYQPGGQFAALYAQKTLGKACNNFRFMRTSDRPDLSARIEKKTAENSSFRPP
jgi:hypothetical protein